MKKKTKNTNKKTKNGATPEADESSGEPKKSRTAAVDYAEFVRTWRDAKSLTEVAEAMNVKLNSASAIAGRLRKAGIDLQLFRRRSSQPIDVKLLNKILAGKD
jgi:hypothetical protein